MPDSNESQRPVRAPSSSLSDAQLNELCNVLGSLVAVIRRHGLEETYDLLRPLGYSDVTSFDPKTGRD